MVLVLLSCANCLSASVAYHILLMFLGKHVFLEVKALVDHMKHIFTLKKISLGLNLCIQPDNMSAAAWCLYVIYEFLEYRDFSCVWSEAVQVIGPKTFACFSVYRIFIPSRLCAARHRSSRLRLRHPERLTRPFLLLRTSPLGNPAADECRIGSKRV